MTFSTGLKSHPYSVALNDFNQNKQLDIIVANQGTKNLVTLLGKGNGMFENQASHDASLYFAPVTIGLGELNNDGHSEIVFAYDNCDYIDILVPYDTGAFPQRMTYITDT
ncbi:unnamed protein product [Rotaria socialis]|uniref:VCBS repeat-containing protein n=1 Tax=Rotaria socialis TaxID=392032 RepID=A0A817R5T8_9BILA|nr:unnamed protein product [Rotaria socialis]CAF3231780.1 unnamed protein product [Rotaria socialis]CAF3470939.1 unnamed protein product [Rotaria socialis]CAF3507313.1 unnamed protein product [Rotaria socialis]CAF4175226.1 unnamed protein product [Rotaria socialis]